MEILIVISVVFSLLAVFFTLSMFGHVRRRRPIRATGSLAGGAATGAVGGASILLAFSYLGYDQLVDERPVCRIEFSQAAPGEYVARVMIDGEPDRLLSILGDEWQLDARVINWKPPATLLGLEPIYRLERLSGRYADLVDEQTAPRSVHALSEAPNLDFWRLARTFPALLPGVDAYYGTATYLPMADGARFEVSLTRTALIARPLNDAARRAVGNW